MARPESQPGGGQPKPQYQNALLEVAKDPNLPKTSRSRAVEVMLGTPSHKPPREMAVINNIFDITPPKIQASIRARALSPQELPTLSRKQYLEDSFGKISTRISSTQSREERKRLNGEASEIAAQLSREPENEAPWRNRLLVLSEQKEIAVKDDKTIAITTQTADQLRELSLRHIDHEWITQLDKMTHRPQTMGFAQKNELYDVVMPIVTETPDRRPTAFGWYRLAVDTFFDSLNNYDDVKNQENKTKLSGLKQQYLSAATDNYIEYRHANPPRTETEISELKTVLKAHEPVRTKLAEEYIKSGKLTEAEQILDELPNTPGTRRLRFSTNLHLARNAAKENNEEACQRYVNEALKSSNGLERIPEIMTVKTAQPEGTQPKLPPPGTLEVAEEILNKFPNNRNITRSLQVVEARRLLSIQTTDRRTNEANLKNAEVKLKAAIGVRDLDLSNPQRTIFAIQGATTDLTKDQITGDVEIKTNNKLRQALLLTVIEDLSARAGTQKNAKKAEALNRQVYTVAGSLQDSLIGTLAQNHSTYKENLKADTQETLYRVWELQQKYVQSVKDPAEQERLSGELSSKMTSAAESLNIKPAEIPSFQPINDLVTRFRQEYKREQTRRRVEEIVQDPYKYNTTDLGFAITNIQLVDQPEAIDKLARVADQRYHQEQTTESRNIRNLAFTIQINTLIQKLSAASGARSRAIISAQLLKLGNEVFTADPTQETATTLLRIRDTINPPKEESTASQSPK